MFKHKRRFSWLDYLQEQSKTIQEPLLKCFYQSQLDFIQDKTLRAAEFVALDFETTGLCPEQDEIVSVGLVPFTLQRIKVAQAKHWLVRPQGQLSDESVVIHGITHSDLSQAPSLDKVLQSLLPELQGKVVVVHYQFIEREFLAQASARLMGQELIFPMIDTMAIEARWHRMGWRSELKRWFGAKQVSIRLADSRVRYGLPRYQMHSALIDAIATAELFQAQVRHRFSDSDYVSDVWQ